MFRAIRVERSGETVSARIAELRDEELGPGDVTVDVEYSGVNYKDGLALMGRPGVIRDYPLIPGIDLTGTVAHSDDPGYRVGDRVVLNGWGIGETHHGGLAERARVDGSWLVPIPETFSTLQAAAIGTAGFTAMLAVLALEHAGALPDEPDAGARDVLVTGAAGGVGSIATALLSRLGHRVVASTGRSEEAGYLRSLGAEEVIDRSELSRPAKPLQSQRWHAAVDSVGGDTLASVLSQLRYGGAAASCGLAQSARLDTTVMPFILRGVTLAGVNSVQAPRPLRLRAWGRLAALLDPGLLETVTTVVPLAEAVGVAERILAGRVRGRTVVDVRA